jgi:hypothetical protein
MRVLFEMMPPDAKEFSPEVAQLKDNLLEAFHITPEMQHTLLLSVPLLPSWAFKIEPTLAPRVCAWAQDMQKMPEQWADRVATAENYHNTLAHLSIQLSGMFQGAPKKKKTWLTPYVRRHMSDAVKLQHGIKPRKKRRKLTAAQIAAETEVVKARCLGADGIGIRQQDQVHSEHQRARFAAWERIMMFNLIAEQKRGEAIA